MAPGSRIPSAPKRRSGEIYDKLEIGRHFTHPLGATITWFSYPDESADDPLSPAESLEPMTAHPLNHIISYISTFINAHPDWDSKRELWVHNRSEDLMKDYGTHEVPGRRVNFGRPIPVFSGTARRYEGLEFAGYYQIDSLRVVAPDSDELLEIHERKVAAGSYSPRGRSPADWERSWAHQWVKLRLSKSPTSAPAYTSLENPMKLRGGAQGEIERYLLEVGGLVHEQAVLTRHKNRS